MNKYPVSKWVRASLLGLHIVEDTLLVSLLGGMILLAAAQILLRDVFSAGFSWADQVLRIMVLWVAMLGAVVASRDNHHINVDLATRFLPPRWRVVAGVFTALFTTLVCSLLAWHSGRFVHEELTYGTRLLGQLPAWMFESILPAAFALIAMRYALLFVQRVLQFLQPDRNIT